MCVAYYIHEIYRCRAYRDGMYVVYTHFYTHVRYMYTFLYTYTYWYEYTHTCVYIHLSASESGLQRSTHFYTHIHIDINIHTYVCTYLIVCTHLIVSESGLQTCIVCTYLIVCTNLIASETGLQRSAHMGFESVSQRPNGCVLHTWNDLWNGSLSCRPWSPGVCVQNKLYSPRKET